MKRLIGSVIVVIVAFTLIIVMMGSNFLYFTDFPSLVIVLLLPFAYQAALFGPAKLVTAFKAPFNKNSSEPDLALSLNFFKTHGKVTWLFSLMATGLSVITVLGNIRDLSNMGPYVAIALLCLVYAVMIDLLLVSPYVACAKQAHEEKIRQMAAGK